MTAELDTRPRSSRTPTRKTLVQKYDIPLNHLEFEYIEKCDNGKEIEQIVKILRSNEEGYYPDLLKCAEDRLRSLYPASRLLRVETRPLDKKSLSREDWKATVHDIDEWSERMKNKEKSLSSDNSQKSGTLIFPEMRKTDNTENKVNQPVENEKANKSHKINSCDYKAWDKYNAELDCLKIDLEDMKKEEERKKQETVAQERLSQESKTTEESAIASLDQAQLDLLSEEEKKDIALGEKVKGNEYYNDKLFDRAIWYYTRSIHIYQNLAAYNNRAACYLTVCKFSLALQDLNKVLEKDPYNVKARYRRAQALQHLNRFEEALEDTRLVLSKNPNHAVAKIMADKLRENCAKLPKIHRLVVQDRETGHSHYCEVTDEELGTRSDIRGKVHVRVNEFGLPVTACQCHVKQSANSQLIANRRRGRPVGRFGCKPPCDTTANDENVTESKNEVIVLKDKVSTPAPEKSSGSSSNSGGPKKIDIIELERITEEDKIDDVGRIGVVTKTLVTDKRTVKSPVVHDDKTEKIHKNEAIKHELMADNASDSTKDVKTTKNKFIQDERLRESNKSEKIPVGQPRACGCSTNYPPFHFKSAWHRIDCEKDSLPHKAQLIKSICPQHLSEAFGNSWESDMLIDIFRCLRYHFDLSTEKDRIAKYLEAVVNFSRFKINYSFLDKDVKKLAQELLTVVDDPQLQAALQK